jgi:hypothetical protein
MTGYLARLKAKIQEKPKPHELSKLPKAPFDSFDSDRGRHICPNRPQHEKPFDSFGSDKGKGFSDNEGLPAELQERIGMAAGSVPERYLDAWARLQVRQPATVTETQWRQAIESAARFFGQWGKLAADFGWMPGDIFDIPTSDGCSGLIWWTAGRTVTALGPEHATAGEPVFDRITGKDWASSYAQGASR